MVVVTGATRGIGTGVAAAYRQRGWSVVINARTVEASRDAHTLAVPGDLTDPATSDRIVGAAMEHFGRIDTLVNNAGIFLSKPFTDYTTADYALSLGVNMTGFFRLTERVVDRMRHQNSGHVVTGTTTLAERGDARVPAALTALTKGGLAAATRSSST